MEMRYRVLRADTKSQVSSARMGAFAAAAIPVLAFLHLGSASAWSADNEAPPAVSPPAVEMDRNGSDPHGGPALRNDEPSADNDQVPESGRRDAPPFGGGCPYRGAPLELIV
jgi:hypothetical protein